MDYPISAKNIIKGDCLETVDDILNDLELGLVTVQDVVDRNCDGAPPEDSYIGVNLGLYVRHTEATLMRFRQLMDDEKRNNGGVGLLTKPTESTDAKKGSRKERS